MKECYMIAHKNRRVLDKRGRLNEVNECPFELTFSTEIGAHKFLKETTLIPERYKWSYFRIKKVSQYIIITMN